MDTKEISVININRIRFVKGTVGKIMPEIEIIILFAYGYCFFNVNATSTGCARSMYTILNQECLNVGALFWRNDWIPSWKSFRPKVE